jgi:hypothetical protein
MKRHPTRLETDKAVIPKAAFPSERVACVRLRPGVIAGAAGTGRGQSKAITGKADCDGERR